MIETLTSQIIEQLSLWGIPAVLILVIILLVQDPDRAEKLARLITKPFFYLFKWFSKFYVSREISINVTEFINKDLLSLLDNTTAKKVKVRLNFVSTKEEINLRKNTVIVRLKENNDQTQNILTAANLAIPSVICPFIRTNIDDNLNKAINLTALKKLADKLGNHARFVYKTKFLDPELLEDPTINDLIQQLIRIDKKGFFISIFANELNYLGEGTYANSDRSNRTAEVIKFLKFLLDIAERDIGSINELMFQSDSFGLGIILLAKVERANIEGLTPYLKRLRRNFYSGCDSVYIVAFAPAWNFLTDFLVSARKDRSYNIVNTYTLQENKSMNYGQTKVALIRVNKIFSDQNLENHLSELEIEAGSIIKGTVADVSIENAVVTFSGLNGYIKKAECSWYSISACYDELQVNSVYDFRVKNINFSMGNIELTRRFDDEDPWRKAYIPKEGETIEITPQKESDFHIICISNDGIETKLPKNEIVWGETLDSDLMEIIGKKVNALVLMVQEENRLIRVSLRELTPNPWEEIKSKFPVGTSMLGTVVSINPQFVNVEISEGIVGRVPKESFHAAGNEYHDFQNNLLVGQKLEVLVQKVWTGKEKMSLELKRNISKN